MNEAEQREQQARGDAFDNLIRALLVVRGQCSRLTQFQLIISQLALAIHAAYEQGVRDPDQIIREMAEMEREEAVEEV